MLSRTDALPEKARRKRLRQIAEGATNKRGRERGGSLMSSPSSMAIASDRQSERAQVHISGDPAQESDKTYIRRAHDSPDWVAGRFDLDRLRLSRKELQKLPQNDHHFTDEPQQVKFGGTSEVKMWSPAKPPPTEEPRSNNRSFLPLRSKPSSPSVKSPAKGLSVIPDVER